MDDLPRGSRLLPGAGRLRCHPAGSLEGRSEGDARRERQTDCRGRERDHPYRAIRPADHLRSAVRSPGHLRRPTGRRLRATCDLHQRRGARLGAELGLRLESTPLHPPPPLGLFMAPSPGASLLRQGLPWWPLRSGVRIPPQIDLPTERTSAAPEILETGRPAPEGLETSTPRILRLRTVGSRRQQRLAPPGLLEAQSSARQERQPSRWLWLC